MKFETAMKELIAANRNNPEAKRAIRETLHLVELHLIETVKKHQTAKALASTEPRSGEVGGAQPLPQEAYHAHA
ncbi:hypothetical protein GMLC_21480 [Geomonas limicola]|uniref:Uncharacterized protein n=1 Tax=Geomonas limicola TaxID=2740186 RepID=A0A6V8NBG9_9BACT|nr:hypothetical protein [Geomonas limicola]GFO68569.1 hypothetical protein GMLC_21480 [Geomonas limicola]